MRRIHCIALLTLAALAGLLAGCHTDDSGQFPNQPNPNNPNNPPDFGPPPPGQNDPLRVTAQAIENDKKAPVNTPLLATIEGGVAPYQVLWFFDADPIVDGSGEAVSVTFSSAGDFQARVQVRDSANVVATDTVEVHVLPPGPDLRIVANGQTGGVVTGRAPLLVNFNTSQSAGVVKRWQWDWEGDGIFDMTSTITGNANHTFANPGTYTPILKATDEEGNVEEASVVVVATF